MWIGDGVFTIEKALLVRVKVNEDGISADLTPSLPVERFFILMFITPTHTSSTRYHTHHQPPHHHISSLIHLVFTHRTHASPQYQFQHILIPYPIRPWSLLKYISTPLYNTYYIPIYPTTNIFLSSQTPSPILFSFVQHFPIIFLFPPYSSFQKTQHLSIFWCDFIGWKIRFCQSLPKTLQPSNNLVS